MIISVDNVDTNRFALIKGEIKRVKFTVRDENEEVIDLSGASTEVTFQAKETKTGTFDLEVQHAEFDVSEAASGIVYCPIDTTGLDAGTDYYCELRIIFSATSVDHSGEIIMTINQPIVVDETGA